MGLGESLLQARDGMWFPRNKAPDSTAQQSVAFASKKPNKYRDPLLQHKERRTMHTTWLGKPSALLLHPWGQHDYRWQATGGNIQERCLTPFTQAVHHNQCNRVMHGDRRLHDSRINREIGMPTEKRQLKNCPTYLVFQATSPRTKWCHTRYQVGWGNLSEATSLQLITSMIFAF